MSELRLSPPLIASCLAGMALLIAGCSDGSDNGSSAGDATQKPQAANPVVEGPVTGGGALLVFQRDFAGAAG